MPALDLLIRESLSERPLGAACDNWQAMARLRYLSRFLVAATLLVAAMLLASAGAQAHAGHGHHHARVEHSAPTAQASTHVRAAEALRSHLDAAQCGKPGSVAWIVDAGPASGEGALACAGGCCHSAGHGCCAAALPGLATVMPPLAGATHLWTRLPWGPGVTPGVLPEPPNHPV
jgi:hypothetical protein